MSGFFQKFFIALILAGLIFVPGFTILGSIFDALGLLNFFGEPLKAAIPLGIITFIITTIVLIKWEESDSWQKETEKEGYVAPSRRKTTLQSCSASMMAVVIVFSCGVPFTLHQAAQDNLDNLVENALTMGMNLSQESIYQKEESVLVITLENHSDLELSLTEMTLQLHDPMKSNMVIIQNRCSVPCFFVSKIPAKEKPIWTTLFKNIETAGYLTFERFMLQPREVKTLQIPFSMIAAGNYQDEMELSIKVEASAEYLRSVYDFSLSESVQIAVLPK